MPRETPGTLSLPIPFTPPIPNFVSIIPLYFNSLIMYPETMYCLVLSTSVANTKQVTQGKGSIAVSEEDGRYRIVRHIATDFSLDSLTLGVCRTLSRESQWVGSWKPWELEITGLGIWKSRHVCLILASAGNTATGSGWLWALQWGERRMFSVTPPAWGTEQVFWMSKWEVRI